MDSVQALLAYDPELGNTVLNRSMQTTSLMDISLREAQETIYNLIQDEEDRSLLSIKELCHCRFYDLPPVPEFHKPSVGMIRSDDLGRLVQFSGTVLRTGMVWLIYPCYLDQDVRIWEGIRVSESPLPMSIQGKSRHRAGWNYGGSCRVLIVC